MTRGRNEAALAGIGVLIGIGLLTLAGGPVGLVAGTCGAVTLALGLRGGHPAWRVAAGVAATVAGTFVVLALLWFFLTV